MRDEELREHIRMLNALTHEWFPWQWTRARKQHEDLFGRLIQPGEHYLKRSNGAAWDAVIKLSQESMELLLYALFSGNFLLEELANEFDQIRSKRIREFHARYSPLRGVIRGRSPSQ